MIETSMKFIQVFFCKYNAFGHSDSLLAAKTREANSSRRKPNKTAQHPCGKLGNETDFLCYFVFLTVLLDFHLTHRGPETKREEIHPETIPNTIGIAKLLSVVRP